MHRLNELAAKLTPDQVREVEHFAESLLSRRGEESNGAKRDYLDVDSFAGMLEGLAPEKTAVELVHEANAAQAAKHDRYLK